MTSVLHVRRGRRLLRGGPRTRPAVSSSPPAEVVHLRGRSRAAATAPDERAYRRSQIAFYAKHHPRWVPWL